MLGKTAPSCLVIRRVRPSRSTGVRGFLRMCPGAGIIKGTGAFAVVKGFFHSLGLTSRGGLRIGGGSALALKGRRLAFMFTPVMR